jgi:UDP-N-acetylmuramoylalanine--D-glutamate ligase
VVSSSKEKDFSGEKISVIGAARSGVGVSKLLKHAGARVFVSDQGRAASLEKSIAEFHSSEIEFETGGHTEKVFACSLMVISPGVPTDAPVVVEAKKRGIRVVSELEVAGWFCKVPIVAVTGSNGKTTTTTLIGRIFSDAKKKHVVAGNIGEAFSNVVLDLAETDIAVLEVSSFQLDFIESFRPAVAVILNITRNHMDRYNNSMDLYAASKARICMNQTASDVLILNGSDEWGNKMTSDAKSRKLTFSIKEQPAEGAFIENGMLKTVINEKMSDVLETANISMKGEHNLQNAMAATLVAQIMGVTPPYIRSTLRNFKGVEHRQEFVREINGIKYINNSKATTVEAVEFALKSYDEPIILILGGKDKGNNYSTIYDLVKKKVRAIVATGASVDIIERAFADKVPVHPVSTIGNEKPNIASMKKTVSLATSLAKRGDVVLLSPAGTSFDWFTDYEERGKVFKSIVNDLAEKP